MDAPAEITSPVRPLVIRVVCDGHEKTYTLRDGLLIGTASTCDVCLPRETWIGPLNPLAAIIRQEHGLRTVCAMDAATPIRLADGTKVERLTLRDGAAFFIGKASFLCVEDAIDEVPQNDRVDRHVCPRCHANLSTVPSEARYCPHCGAPLPADCPEWPILAPMPSKVVRVGRWRALLPRWLFRYRADDPLFFGRRTTVLAYINTLFNLGLNLERPNWREANRYYRKAARLGSLPARVRLALKQKQP